MKIDFPHAVQLMVRQGRLGQKSGSGFYRRWAHITAQRCMRVAASDDVCHSKPVRVFERPAGIAGKSQAQNESDVDFGRGRELIPSTSGSRRWPR
jgi:3-hydroxyacyl-CoA dehydrogenase